MSICLREEHEKNVPFLICVIDEGIVIFSNEVQSLKA